MRPLRGCTFVAVFSAHVLALSVFPSLAQEGCEFLICDDKPRPPQAPAPSPQTQQQRAGTYWMHNGSIMYLQAVIATGERKFFYFQPTEGMTAAGAKPGTLLFDGRRRGIRYEGTARIFRGHCGAFPYAVRGNVVNDETVVMTGAKPDVDQASCRIIGHKPDRLEFNYQYKVQ
jgi:hypothetical protein